MTNGDDLPADALSEERAGLELMKLGQLELARYKIAMLSKKYPNVSKFHFNYALVLFKLKRYDEALDEINAGLWLKPDDLKATKFKREIMEMSSTAKAAETARINESETTSTSHGVVKDSGRTLPENEAPSITVTMPATEEKTPTSPTQTPSNEPVRPDTPKIAVAESPQPEPAPPSPAQESQKPQTTSPASEPMSEKQSIASTQPETMPAIRVHSPQPVEASTEPETMPAVKVPVLADEAAKATEPEAAKTAEPEAAKATEPEAAKATEPEAAKAAEPEAAKATEPEAAKAAEPEAAKAAEPEAAKAAEPEAAKAAEPEAAKAAEPEAAKAAEPEAAKAAEPEAAKVAAPIVTNLPEPTIEQNKQPTNEHGQSKSELEPAVVGVDNPTSAEPTFVSSIPGPTIIEPAPSEGKQSAPGSMIEVEPRVTILEKAADITVEAIDNRSPIPPEEPKEEIEPAPTKQAPPETRESSPKPAPSSPRLTNLKDLFKVSRAKTENAHEPIIDTGAVLAGTVELEPIQAPTRTDAVARAGEGELVTFSSYKELESYKFSIQALVEKYLFHKLDREIPGVDDEDSTPVIVEDDATSSQEATPFSESDLPPHEAASIDNNGTAAGSEEITAERTEPQPSAVETAVLAGEVLPAPATGALLEKEPVAVAPPVPTPVAQPADGGLGNVAGNQQPLVEILSATSERMLHRLDIDIVKFINATVMAKTRTGRLMQVNGENLAQIVDMETYAAMVRLNRTMVRIKQSKSNTINSRLADEAIKELEAGVQPVKGYRPDGFLKEESVDAEKQFAQPSLGSQQGLTDDALAKFIEHVREVGEGHVTMAIDGDDAPIKAETMKIKRLALDLYNNTQYEQSIQVYSALLDYFPEDFEALFNIGFCYRELGNYKESEAMFKRIVELFYDNAYAWYNLSVIYSITTEGDKEAYCLQRAREFGYAVDVNRLSRLLVSYTPKNPFDS